MKLSQCSLLVTLSISQWTARKYDKSATREIAAKHGIDSQVGRYNKSLLPMTDDLNNITNLAAGIRIWFYANTLPYTYEGVRLLPSKGYFEFINDMNSRLQAWRGAVDKFLAHYDVHVKNAEDMLGPLYKVEDYPTPENIKERFSIDVKVSPVPDEAGFFNVLVDDMAKEQAVIYAKEMENTAQKATRECWERLHGVVTKFVEKLASEAATLREDHVQSMLDNAQEMCILLTKLNIMNDPDLEALRSEVESSLCAYSASVLSTHDLTKNQVKDAADAILRKMSAFMGGIQPT